MEQVQLHHIQPVGADDMACHVISVSVLAVNVAQTCGMRQYDIKTDSEKLHTCACQKAHLWTPKAHTSL